MVERGRRPIKETPMKLEVGKRYLAVTAKTRVMLFAPRSKKDIRFFNKMRRNVAVTFMEVQ